MEKRRKIVICIPTCNRHIQLKRLLDSIAEQKNIPEDCLFEVLLVNNDGRNSLDPVLQDVKNYPFTLHTITVNQRGYANVRNGAVSWVLNGDACAIIFVDDDEVVPSDWLKNMIKAWQKHKNDIITGPVEQVLPPSTSRLMKNLHLFGRNYDAQTGAKLKYANSNNTLVSRKVLDTMGPTFHKALNHSGGEDTLFFHQCFIKGFSICWDNSILIQEPTSPERASLTYVLNRCFKNGKNRIRLNAILYPDNWKGVSRKLIVDTTINIFKKFALSIVTADSTKFGETVSGVFRLVGLSVQMRRISTTTRIYNAE